MVITRHLCEITMSLPTPADALTALDYAVVDVETTGLNPLSGDRVCEVAVVRRRQGRTIDTFQSLVYPQRQISLGAAQVNHLSDADVAHAPLFADIAPRLVSILDGAVFVAHNAPFDLGFLANEWQRLRWPPRNDFVVDTLALARRLYAFPSNSLAAVARRLGVTRSQAHRALGDVQTTARILDRMLGDLQRRGVLTLGDVLDWQGGNVPWPAPPHLDLPEPLRTALAENRQLWLRYETASGLVTERWVQPLCITGDARTTYLVAFCLLRQEQRNFSLARILEMILGPEAT